MIQQNQVDVYPEKEPEVRTHIDILACPVDLL